MNTNLLTGLIFVAVFGSVILIHELGHFVVGKLFKVEIEEFGIGIPPKMLTLFQWRETEFTLNWLPFGGFNRFKGENNPEIEGGLAAANPWVRLAVLLAGATMNLLLGVLVYSIIIAQLGIPDFNTIQVFDVTPGSPAAQAGFRVEDIFLKINGETIKSEPQLRGIIHDNLDKELLFTLQRGDEIIETAAIPLSSRSAEDGALGFLPSYGYQPSPSFLTSLSYGVQTTFYTAKDILLLPAQLLRGSLSPDEARFLGFRGIYNILQQTVNADVESRAEQPAATSSAPTPVPPPTYYTLNLIASLTITLGVFNLLPFPALDGGRIFFVLPEIFLKKRVPAKFENIVHGVGIMLLLGFMLYVNVMDFIDPVNIVLP